MTAAILPKGIKTVTLSDTVDQGSVIGLRCTTAGNVKITDRHGNATTLAMTLGETVWVQVRLVWSTGTTGAVLAYID